MQKRQLVMNQRFKFSSVKDEKAFIKDEKAFIKDERHYLLKSAEKFT